MARTHPSLGRGLRWLAVGLLALLAACGEPAANVGQPKRYDRLGVQMQIPGNWKLSDDERVSGMHYLAVESPGSALFIAMIQSDGGRDLGEFARSFSADADKSMPAMLSGESRFDLSGFAEGTVRERYVASIGGVKVPHLREYHKITGAHRTAFLITQSAEEDLAQTQPGFDLLVKSFKLTDR